MADWLADLASRVKPAIQAYAPNVTLHLSSASTLPSSPDAEYVKIQDTGGFFPLKVHNQSKPKYERPSAQIEAASRSHVRAAALARAAYNALVENSSNVTINGTFYRSITAVQTPSIDLGLDAAGRVRIAFNVNADHGTT